MEHDFHQKVWYLDVPGAAPGQEYRFLINNGEEVLERTDPYARMLSAQGWPLVHSPAFDWEGHQFLSSRIPLSELIVYELHVGTFVQNGSSVGTFLDVVSRLDYLQELGINAIELMPVVEFRGEKNWGYDPLHSFAIERTYGTPEDLKTLVREAHKRGIEVFLDVLFNHFYGNGENYLFRFDGHDDVFIDGVYFYEDGERLYGPWGPRPNFDLPEVRRYFLDNLVMWMVEYGMDGFRWDSTVCIRRPTGFFFLFLVCLGSCSFLPFPFPPFRLSLLFSFLLALLTPTESSQRK